VQPVEVGGRRVLELGRVAVPETVARVLVLEGPTDQGPGLLDAAPDNPCHLILLDPVEHEDGDSVVLGLLTPLAVRADGPSGVLAAVGDEVSDDVVEAAYFFLGSFGWAIAS
jgi:hypothetical protein